MGCFWDNSGGGKWRKTSSWSGKTAASLFDLLDYLTTNIMTPISGLLIALFAGWVMSMAGVMAELEEVSPVAQLSEVHIRFAVYLVGRQPFADTERRSWRQRVATLQPGWVMSEAGVLAELEMGGGIGYRFWRFVIRYIAPIGVAVVFIYHPVFGS